MPRACLCCTHPRRAEMEAQHIMGVPLRAIEAAFGVRYDAVHRHMRGHLPNALAATAIASQAAPLQPVATPIVPEADAPVGSHTPRAWQLDDVPAAEEPQGSPSTSASAPIVQSQPAHVPAAPSGGPSGPVDIWAAVHALHARGLAVLNRAETGGDDKLTLAALRELRGVVETLARLAPAHGTTTAATPYTATTEWSQLRAVILDALAHYPDARLAVADALTTSGALL